MGKNFLGSSGGFAHRAALIRITKMDPDEEN
jgi:hypothetical protein